MTVTVADKPVPGRLAAACRLARYAARLALRPSTPVPALHLSVPVPPGPRAQRVEWLAGLAESLGTVPEDRGAAQVVTGQVAGVTLTARLHADDLTRQILTTGEISAVRSMAAGYIPGGAA